MEYTQEQLQQRYENLPKDIKHLLFTVEFARTIDKLGKKYNLHIDEMGTLGEEIGLVMLGVTRSEDFFSNIQNKLKLSLDDAGELVKDINVQVFYPIRESLKRVSDPDFGRDYRAEVPPKVNPITEQGVDNSTSKPSGPQDNPLNLKEGDNLGAAMFNQKMSHLFHLPKEEQKIETSKSSKNYIDHYREPIE